MDEIQLTELFVEYKKTKIKLDALEEAIQAEVLRLGDSQKIAGVKATFYQPSRKVDYEAAAKTKGITDAIVDEFSTIKKIIKWKEVAEAVKADLTAFTVEEPAHVIVKI